MTDTLQFDLGIDDDDRRVVLLGDMAIDRLPDLVSAAPGLTPLALARAALHLGAGDAFRLIEDPVAYARQTRARLEAEPAGQPWQDGAFRLRDHGVPDVRQIAAPAVSGGKLVFFAADGFIGAPYRVEADLTADAPDERAYVPLPLRPLPASAAPSAPAPYWAGDERETRAPDATRADDAVADDAEPG